jgi:DNA-directed RNA polymerase subunit M/transcription elongation factor TFIIS
MMYKITDPNKFRDNIQLKLVETVKSVPHENEKVVPSDMLLRNLEKGIFNYAIREAGRRNIVKKWDNPSFVHLYMDRLRSVYLNLQHPELMQKIRRGDLPPENVAFLTHHEMNPGKWKEIIERKMMRDASKLNSNIQASTDMYTCSRCKSKKTVYYEMATRSADEQMTIFITCLDCGKNWKR